MYHKICYQIIVISQTVGVVIPKVHVKKNFLSQEISILKVYS